MMALSVLAGEYGNEPVAIGRIARSEHIPQRFLEGILLTLKNRGILSSTRGKQGGYYLTRHPADVSLYDVVVCFEGTVSMLACACEVRHRPCEFCKAEQSCPIRKPFSDINRHAIDTLCATTLQDIATNS